MSYQHLRKDYKKSAFSFEEAPEQPLELFRIWLDDAIEAGLPDANAMCLSTVDQHNRPSSRYVLLKELNSEGIIFFTNYNSIKARDIEINPQVALCFYWMALERQLRVEGVASKISRQESVLYFDSRPFESRISAIVSPQSQVIPNKKILEEKIPYYQSNPAEVQCPEHWGGYLIRPSMIEFWQGRGSRLHDRLRYARVRSDIVWKRDILAP
ncbi:MAG: pyridoxamine 5'-phosphate oxidase [Saprospiraceae bacterium]|nr:pyridoxamine 5'-phosphate oxidase [Saprospiraceae bacterium]HMW37910.1 pyridoxamine 5'-phosphate oxidase [Saprospiraceae bacterium]HMX87346.1 pyridoxamine 5'-phosphate oxidase [Saprospiraceae bacterium]HMZ39173.1 pyridoxamine 5'-phosphate oxidase [Saprospiraceae bacterium]HNA63834.1 pyridoxamine 5'-phosphate oxidase [Saprospiraceae bacterium]